MKKPKTILKEMRKLDVKMARFQEMAGGPRKAWASKRKWHKTRRERLFHEMEEIQDHCPHKAGPNGFCLYCEKDLTATPAAARAGI
ncbi:MAG: hypothetical protein WC645_07960 [Candidatus Margulisiibacteriota bacterium]